MRLIWRNLVKLTCLLFLVVFVVPAKAQTSLQLYGVVQREVLLSYPTDEGASFGFDVAISGSTAVVSAPYSNLGVDEKGLYGSGAVYVYTQNDDDSWTQQQMVMPRDPKVSDLYGYAVDIDGDTLVVGAPGREDDDNNVGVVYVFVRQDGEWVQEARLEPEFGSNGDGFGTSVAVVGDRVLVGSPGADVDKYKEAGKVFEFIRSGSKWYQKAPITASDAYSNAAFGSAISVDGSRMVVGAPSPDKIGSAYVFYRNGGSWREQAKINASNAEEGDSFGAAVAVSSGIVVVGAPHANPNFGYGEVVNAGAVYQFKSRGGDWTQVDMITIENGQPFDHFGDSLDVNSQFLVVGASGVDDHNNLRAGSSYLFLAGTDGWERQTQIFPALTSEDGSFGTTVALSGDTVMIGEPGPLIETGNTYYFSIAQGYLPNTGFSPGVETVLPAAEKADYSYDSGLRLTIPSLSLDSEIVGVPRQDNDWDVRWLGNSLGYLDGTAYPGTIGNTVLVGHVYGASGYAGPFINLKQLKWGDEIILSISGEQYTYQVRETYETTPEDMSALESQEDYFWITLVTCSDYNESTDEYLSRYVVLAIMVE